MKKLLTKIREMLRDRRNRRLFTQIVSVIAAVVVFVTTYALVLPAITMETEANCGIQAHQHDDSCYEEELICGQAEEPGHHHTDACYTTLTALICMEQEHQHDDSCYDAEGNLTCELSEHTHDDACYEESKELTCGLEESDGHQHTDACYERVLTCGMEAHTHSAACYSHASEGAAGGSGASSEDYAVVAATTEAAGERVSMPSDDGDDSNAVDTPEIDRVDNIAVDVADTGLSSLPAAEDAYVPELEPLFFNQVLTKKTGIYYFHPEEGKTIPENSADITDWTRVADDTDLDPNDILRVYLRYTIPAGSLNSTNPVARYRLPANLHLTDQQMEEINTNVNGIANQYVNLDTLEILDPDQYNQYLGIEAVEGTRTPADDINEYFDKHPGMNRQEYISATVQAENTYDTEGLYGEKDAYLGQDLIFTFTPYTIQKNQHEYDADGQPTKAGEKVYGWLCFDVQMDQFDWSEPVVTTVTVDEEAQDTDAAADADKASGTDLSADPAANADEVSDTAANMEQETESAPVHQTVIELKDSNAEILFAGEDKSLKIDEISTNLRMIERTEVTSEEDANKEQDEDTAVTEENGGESDLTAVSSEEDTENTDQTVSDEADGTDKADESGDEDAATEIAPAIEINAETYPAVSFEDSIVVRAGSLNTDNEIAAKDTPEETTIVVSVTAEAETFPLGTTMVLGTVDDMDTVASAVEGAVEGQTRGFHAVDISFHNADGEEIEPLKPIKVSMTSEAIKQAVEDSSTVPVVMHVENPADSATTDNISADAATADPEATDSASKDDAAKDATKTDAVSNEADSATDMTGPGPESASYAEDKASADGSPADSFVRSSESPQAESTTSAPTATIVETKETTNTANSVDKKETTDTISFDAGSFSVYAIVYTVDFHYQVNGKKYDFSIPGGGFVSLEHLVEVLGIAATDENTENEAESGENVTAYEEAIKLNEVEVSKETKKFVASVESVEFSNPELVWVGKLDEAATVGEIKEKKGLEVKYSAELTEEQITEINEQTVDAGDWALISRKSFSSQETLTVTMETGEVFTIKVTDAMDQTKPYDRGESFTAYDTRLDGFTINLFDYGPESSLDGGNNNLTNKGDGYNSGINTGHDLKFTAYGRKPSEEKTNGRNVLTQNHFSGTDAATQGIVEKTLSGGYPKLAVGNRESLSYLFNTTPDGNNKIVYKNVYGLFQKDSDGKYGYDSDSNYAYYNPNQGNQGKFVLCDTFPEEGSSDSIGRWGVGFFPFNPWNGTKDCIHWNGYCPATGGGNSGRYYYNHHFGMTLEGKFQMTPDGKLNDHDMEFNFSGDDDLWVFIDDVLVLDIGGVHNPVGGNINFRTGDVTVNSAYQVNSVINDSVSGPAATTTIAQRFADAGKTWDPSAYSEHTIKVFYVERGGCYSNCRMEFNLTRFKDIEFDKKDQHGDIVEGAEFKLFKEDGVTPAMETYIDHDDNDQVKTREYIAYSDENGHVKFNYVPVGNYVIKETSVPDGYIMDKAPLTGRVSVQKNEDGSVSVVKSDFLRNGQISDRAINIKQKNITVSLEKQWKENGAMVEPPSGTTASFNLVRVSTVTEQYTYTPEKRKATVRLLGANNQALCSDLSVEVGDTIKIDGYQLGYFNNNNTWNPSDQVLLRGQSIGTIQTKHNYGTVTNADPITYTIKESDVDSNGQVVLKLGSKNRENFDNLPILSIQSKGQALNPVTDTREVESQKTYETFSLPDAGWTREFTVPLYNDEGNECKYYFEEISNSANASITYVDKNGNTVQSASEVKTNEDGTTQTIINNVTTRTITVTKQWDPSTPPANASVTIELYKDGVATGDTVTLDGTEDENGEAPGWTATFKVPEDGAIYTVQETGVPSGYALVSMTTTASTGETVWVPVNGLSDGQQYLIVQGNKALRYQSGNVNVVDISKTGTMITSADAACVFTMTADQSEFRIHPASDSNVTLGRNYTPWQYRDGQLIATDGDGQERYLNLSDQSKLYNETPASVELYTSVRVPADGNIGYTLVNKNVEEPKTADIQIIKADSTDGHPINGAVFKLLAGPAIVIPSAENGIAVTGATVSNDGAFTVPTGGVTITGLPVGTYTIYEVSPPAGYVITNGPTKFIVKDDGTIEGKDAPADGEAYKFIISNEPGVALPNTGGPGTKALYLLGIMLTGLASTCLVMGRRRKAT